MCVPRHMSTMLVVAVLVCQRAGAHLIWCDWQLVCYMYQLCCLVYDGYCLVCGEWVGIEQVDVYDLYKDMRSLSLGLPLPASHTVAMQEV